MSNAVDKVVSTQEEHEKERGRALHSRASYSPSYCEECGYHTTERKPYCTNHIEKLPYIANLIAQLEQQDKENEKAEHGKASVDALTAKDIVAYLKSNDDGKGTRGTLKQIAHRLGVAENIVLAFTKKLAKKKLVRIFTCKRRLSVALV